MGGMYHNDTPVPQEIMVGREEKGERNVSQGRISFKKLNLEEEKNREEMYRAVLNSLNCKQDLEGEEKGHVKMWKGLWASRRSSRELRVQDCGRISGQATGGKKDNVEQYGICEGVEEVAENEDMQSMIEGSLNSKLPTIWRVEKQMKSR